mgnify:CR=1 FL=1
MALAGKPYGPKASLKRRTVAAEIGCDPAAEVEHHPAAVEQHAGGHAHVGREHERPALRQVEPPGLAVAGPQERPTGLAVVAQERHHLDARGAAASRFAEAARAFLSFLAFDISAVRLRQVF